MQRCLAIARSPGAHPPHTPPRLEGGDGADAGEAVSDGVGAEADYFGLAYSDPKIGARVGASLPPAPLGAGS